MPNLLSETPGLIAFVRTVEAGSFSAAAKLLKTTPSAVSKSVGRLEKLVQTRLFLRSTRALVLTSDGHAFFERVSPLLRDLDVSDGYLASPEAPSGRVRFSMPSELAPLFLEPILSDFAARFPEVYLEIGLTDRYVDLIRENYDVVFRVGAIDQGELIARRLADLRMVLVGSPAYADIYGAPRTPEDAEQLPFARYTVNGNPNVVRFPDGSHFVPRGRVDCDTGQALRSAALHGLGAALLMRCIVRDDLANGRLVDLSRNLELPTLQFNAVHAFGRMLPGRVRLLCDFVAEHAKTVEQL